VAYFLGHPVDCLNCYAVSSSFLAVVAELTDQSFGINFRNALSPCNLCVIPCYPILENSVGLAYRRTFSEFATFCWIFQH